MDSTENMRMADIATAVELRGSGRKCEDSAVRVNDGTALKMTTSGERWEYGSNANTFGAKEQSAISTFVFI